MIIIDYKDRRPIYEQIVERFENLILSGALQPHSQLPSVRNLAMELSINPNTIQRAYSTLEQENLIYSIKGKGSFISPCEQLAMYKKDKIKKELKVCIKKAKQTGIKLEEVIIYCREAYKEGEKDD